MNLEELEAQIAQYENFPIEGVLFRDLSPLFQNSLSDLIDHVSRLIGETVLKECDFIAGVESRGFILASALACKHKKGLVLIRKAGKLPGDVLKEEYQLEYAKAAVEMQPGKGKLVIVDDVLATGGTLNAAVSLSQKAGYKLLDVAVCINLKDLNSYSFRGKPVKSLFVY